MHYKYALVDSSGWLEYFTDQSNASFFSKPIQNTDSLLVPTICLYEVKKQLLLKVEADWVDELVTVMQKGKVIDLTSEIAGLASEISIKYKIAMADSIIYATAQHYQARLYTQDIDFKNFEGVSYIPKK